MKKLRLKALELGALEILTREQLRNEIAGGYGSSSLSYGGGCGHNIGCSYLGDSCGSYNVCTCAAISGSLYCRH
jgi:hypothetical protein